MTKQEFIEAIAKAVIKIAPKYGIEVYSPVIAQACLESGYGTSNKAKFNNFFGLKYRANRVTCNSGYFTDSSAEQKADGTYIPISTDWYAFDSIESGVEGYFQFINTSRYSNLKGIKDPYQYLATIKADGYATSIDYVTNVYNTLIHNDLTKYDKKQEVEKMGYTNSSLVSYTKISPNKTVNRNHKIDRITIHCVVGQVTVESLGNVFAPASRQASSNYGVGKDGRIGMYCEEKDRSWCSSSAENDNRAITIEVASDTTDPYAVTDAALQATIKLCIDICKRNGIKKMIWISDKNKALSYQLKDGEGLFTVHRWFAAKSCPGAYLFGKHDYICSEVNKALGTSSEPVKTPVGTTDRVVTGEMYRVRKSWADASSQIGAYTILDNAKKACKEGYTVFDKAGKAVYSIPKQDTYTTGLYKTKDIMNIRTGPGVSNKKVGEAPLGVYTIVKVQGCWGYLKSGAGWICIDKEYATKVK